MESLNKGQTVWIHSYTVGHGNNIKLKQSVHTDREKAIEAWRLLGGAINEAIIVETPLYNAPPAPVSVPDDVMAAMQKVARIRLDLNDFDGDKRGILDCLGDAEEALIEVVNRRAAMLRKGVQ